MLPSNDSPKVKVLFALKSKQDHVAESFPVLMAAHRAFQSLLFCDSWNYGQSYWKDLFIVQIDALICFNGFSSKAFDTFSLWQCFNAGSIHTIRIKFSRSPLYEGFFLFQHIFNSHRRTNFKKLLCTAQTGPIPSFNINNNNKKTHQTNPLLPSY